MNDERAVIVPRRRRGEAHGASGSRDTHRAARPNESGGANGQSRTAGDGARGRDNFCCRPVSKTLGDAFELHALRYLMRRGLALIARNVRYRGGEIDLVMRDRDGTIVFVEVRSRRRIDYGGALASVGARKRARLILAARLFLVARAGHVAGRAPPPCRFDIVAFERGKLSWVPDAFGEDRRLR